MGSKIRTETLRYLGFCYKRLGRCDHAVETWEAIIQEGLDDIQAYEELAKYHEHRTKQIEIAIDFVSRALQKLELADSVNFTTDLDFSREGLEYRLGRLRRKKEKRRTE